MAASMHQQLSSIFKVSQWLQSQANFQWITSPLVRWKRDGALIKWPRQTGKVIELNCARRRTEWCFSSESSGWCSSWQILNKDRDPLMWTESEPVSHDVKENQLASDYHTFIQYFNTPSCLFIRHFQMSAQFKNWILRK